MSSTEKKSSARKRTTTPRLASAAPRSRAPRRAGTDVPTRQDIERRAYEIFLRDGRHGHDLEHWLQAERELQHN